MSTLATIAILVVAALHLVFMVLETFLWTTPRGRRIFGNSREDAETTKVLAQNQGVYNGALAFALGHAALAGPRELAVVLLLFVVVVGIYGGFTAKRTILWLQALPGAVALALVLAS